MGRFANASLMGICFAVLGCAAVPPGTDPGKSFQCPAGGPAPGRPHKLKIRLNNLGAPKAVVRKNDGRKADKYCVRPGDTVEWHLTGRGFRIEFRERSPFEGELSESPGKVVGKVRQDVQPKEEFKYWVVVRNQPPLDPIIIIRTAQ